MRFNLPKAWRWKTRVKVAGESARAHAAQVRCVWATGVRRRGRERASDSTVTCGHADQPTAHVLGRGSRATPHAGACEGVSACGVVHAARAHAAGWRSMLHPPTCGSDAAGMRPCSSRRAATTVSMMAGTTSSAASVEYPAGHGPICGPLDGALDAAVRCALLPDQRPISLS